MKDIYFLMDSRANMLRNGKGAVLLFGIDKMTRVEERLARQQPWKNWRHQPALKEPDAYSPVGEVGYVRIEY